MNTVVEKGKAERTRTITPTTAERPFVAPDVNIYETEDAFVLQAEMPGVTKEALEIVLEGNALTFVGRRDEELLPGNPLYRESRNAHYRRVFELDPSIDTDRIAAEMHQGVLTLRLPKAERVKPRKIEIK
jgi:HSP20 family protein